MPRNLSSNAEAIKNLEKAVELDPNFAPSWSELGQRYYYEAEYAHGGLEAEQKAREAEQKALTLDPELMAAAGHLATTSADAGNLAGAYKQAKAMVRRRPDSGVAHFTLSYVLRYLGLLQEAMQECDTALQLDPGNYQFRTCAVPFVSMGNYERARTFVNLDEGSDWANMMTMTILRREGKNKEALDTERECRTRRFSRGVSRRCAWKGSRARNTIARRRKRRRAWRGLRIQSRVCIGGC